MQAIAAFYLGKIVLVCVLVGYGYMFCDYIRENVVSRKQPTV
jgi:hypothetical protein